MKTAIYIEDGVTQLVITPETEFEKNALKSMKKESIEAKIFHGSFYDCSGGWVRQTANLERGGRYDGSSSSADNSLIIQAKEKEK